MITNKEEHESLVKSGMFWEFHPLLSGNWKTDKSYFEMEKAKIINTDNFEGNIKIEQKGIKWEEKTNLMLKEHRQSAQKYSIDNNEEYYEQEKSFGELRKITLKDEEKNWSNYLVEQKENSIIKSTVLEKYINKLKEKELVYKECINCDSNMIFLSEAIQTLKELEAELTLKTNI